MNKKSVKQSTMFFAIGGITLFLSVVLTILSLMVVKCYNNAILARDRQLELMQLGNELIDASELLTNEVREYVQFGDSENYDNYWKEINETKTMENVLKRLKELDIPEEELELVEQAVKSSDALKETDRQAM